MNYNSCKFQKWYKNMYSLKKCDFILFRLFYSFCILKNIIKRSFYWPANRWRKYLKPRIYTFAESFFYCQKRTTAPEFLTCTWGQNSTWAPVGCDNNNKPTKKSCGPWIRPWYYYVFSLAETESQLNLTSFRLGYSQQLKSLKKSMKP